jgi:hypothetical protein
MISINIIIIIMSTPAASVQGIFSRKSGSKLGSEKQRGRNSGNLLSGGDGVSFRLGCEFEEFETKFVRRGFPGLNTL